MTVPVKTLAAILNLSARRIQQLANDGIIPRTEHGKYELVPAVRGYVKYLQDLALGKTAGPIDSHMEKGRLLRAQADKTELEVRVLRGTLITAEQVENMWQMITSAFRARMLALPTKIAPLVMPLSEFQAVERVLREHIHEALAELARHEPERIISAGGPHAENGSSAAEADGQPVGRPVPEAKPRGKRGAGQVAD